MTHCEMCGRVLTAPESVKRGIGPVCWEKLDRKYKDQVEMPKGPREDNIYPDLRYYQRMVRRTCPTCKNLLDPIDHFFHDDGYHVKGFKKRQWLYAHCPKCGIDFALWKITKRSYKISCFMCHEIIQKGEPYEELNKSRFPGNARIFRCKRCSKLIKKDQEESLNTLKGFIEVES